MKTLAVVIALLALLYLVGAAGSSFVHVDAATGGFFAYPGSRP